MLINGPYKYKYSFIRSFYIKKKSANPKYANETHYCSTKKFLSGGKYYKWNYVDPKKCNKPTVSELKTLQNAAKIHQQIPTIYRSPILDTESSLKWPQSLKRFSNESSDMFIKSSVVMPSSRSL